LGIKAFVMSNQQFMYTIIIDALGIKAIVLPLIRKTNIKNKKNNDTKNGLPNSASAHSVFFNLVAAFRKLFSCVKVLHCVKFLVDESGASLRELAGYDRAAGL